MINIFITGASSGIGQALATAYAKHYAGQSAVLGLVARRAEQLESLAATLRNQYQITCHIYACDVRDVEKLFAAARHFISLYGTPNIVIANAGVSSGTLSENKEDITTFQAVMDINVMGIVHTFSPFIEPMKQLAKQNQTAQLVGVASVAGIRGLPGAGAYSASKAAAITYLESLRVEMQLFGISVTTIAPGYIKTPMTDINEYPMPFLMEPQAFAEQFIKAVNAKKRFKIIPWQMGIVAKILRLIPPVLWDWILKKAPHKARLNIK
jgi:short-subunit dehydrogenase